MPTVESVVLVAGALRKQGTERLEIAWHRFRCEPRGETAVQKAGRRMRRPVQTMRIRSECLVFGGKMGTELDNVESRPGNKFEREIERLRSLDCLRHSGGYSRVTQPAKGSLGNKR